MDKNIGMILNAEQFIRNFFKVYLEDRDFPLLISMLHKDITWFGTGAKEVCKNYKETISLLEKESLDGRFNILDQWYETLAFSEDRCLVYGELDIIGDRSSIISMKLKSRFSMICAVDEGEIKLYHANYSVQKKEPQADEFTIEFISEGFTSLTGYTKTELDELFGGKHLSIVYPSDLSVLKDDLTNQLKTNNYFSVEYRINGTGVVKRFMFSIRKL